MMYHNTVSGVSGGNGNCSGGSPNSTPPNINACSSTTPPLSSGQTSQSDGNEMVQKEHELKPNFLKSAENSKTKFHVIFFFILDKPKPKSTASAAPTITAKLSKLGSVKYRWR